MGQSSEQHIYDNERDLLYCKMELGHYFNLPNEKRTDIEVISVYDDIPEYKKDDVLMGLLKDKKKINKMIYERKQRIKSKIKK